MSNAPFSPTATPSPALELRDLHVWYDAPGKPAGLPTVRGIDLTVRAGDRVGLVGESGCGKTTTILAAMGLLPPSATVAGEVRLAGTDVLSAGEAGIASHRWRDIAMVFQGAMSAFNPVTTIGAQLTEALSVHRVAEGAAARKRASELFDLVGLPASALRRYPHQFSGGMKQRAMIAMALSCDPAVLLADEPTTALDVVVQAQVLRLLTRLSEELGLALVLVTHDLGVVAETCTSAAVMKDGLIVEQGPPAELARAAQHPYTRELFAATPSLATAAAREPVDIEPGRPVLEVRGLHVRYPDHRPRRERAAGPLPDAVDGIDLKVSEGELVALVGQSGCGKTSTMMAVLGLEPCAAGSVHVDGTELAGLRGRPLRDLRRHVQAVAQDPYDALDGRYRVIDTVEEPLRVHPDGTDRDARRERASDALREVGLDPDVIGHRYPHELSGGQRQRVAIAAALVLRPRLLLADEPVSMLDVSIRVGVLELLDRLRRTHRMGILMITHDLSTAAGYADRIIVMHDGKIEEEGTTREVVTAPQRDYTRLLLASVPDPNGRTDHGPAAIGPTSR